VPSTSKITNSNLSKDIFFNRNGRFICVKLLKNPILHISRCFIRMLPFKKQIENYKLVDYLLLLVIVVGIFLRLFHYFSNRSLWLDEGYLVSSLLRLNYHELLNTSLDYQQKAPVGFLLVVKFFLTLLGNNQYSLRIVPLLSGILSILVFVPVAKYFLKEWGLFTAATIICLSPAFIYHSVEIKQYSTELLCSVLSFYLILKFKNFRHKKDYIILSLGGAVMLWFSYSAIFILGGIGIGLSVHYSLTRQWGLLFKSFIPFSIWLISFIFLFVLFINKIPDADWVVKWFRFYDNFLPLPPKSLSDLNWIFINFYRMLDYPLGLLWNFAGSAEHGHLYNIVIKMPFLPMIIIFVGIYFCYKHSRENFALLIAPLLLVFLASGLEYYPLTERFWLFISPVFLVFIGISVDGINIKKGSTTVKSAIVVLLLISPIIQAFDSVKNQETFYVHKKSFQKELFQLIDTDFRKGDAVYIYWNELSGYNVLRKLSNYKFHAIQGKDFRSESKNLTEYNSNLSKDFERFKRHKRVWVVFNNKYLSNVGDPINSPSWYYDNKNVPSGNLRAQLTKIGTILKTVKTYDVTFYLVRIGNDALNVPSPAR